MILAKIFASLAICGCAVCLLSCKKETRVDATKAFEQSFEASEPPVKQAIATVSSSVKAGNYTEAARALEPALVGRTLTLQQREACGLMFKQINQTLAANPGLDSKELYDLRTKLALAARGNKF